MVDFKFAQSFEVNLSLIVVVGLFSLFITFFNAVVLLSFGLDPTVRQPKNYFIVSLAVSDLLIGLTSMPLYTQYFVIGEWSLGTELCRLWLSFAFSVYYSSQYNVLFMTMDRYLSVRIPAKYSNWRTNTNVIYMIAIAWLLPSAFHFTVIIGWKTFTGRTSKPGQCRVPFEDFPVLNLCLTIFFFWIPLLATSMLYCGILNISLNLEKKTRVRVSTRAFSRQGSMANVFISDFSKSNKNNKTCHQLNSNLNYFDNKEVDNHLNHSRHSSKEGLEESSQSSIDCSAIQKEFPIVEESVSVSKTTICHFLPSRTTSHSSIKFQNKTTVRERPTDSIVSSDSHSRKAKNLITFILAAFIIFHSPYHMVVLLRMMDFYVPLYLYYFFYWLCYVNSAINPFVYAYVNPKFKRTFVRVMRFDFHRGSL